MKDWILGRRLMEEQPGGEGDQGGGGGTGDQGGEGGEEQPKGGDGGTGGDPDDHDKGTAKRSETAGGREGDDDHNNALGEELNKGGEPKPGDKPNGEEKPKDPPPDPNAPTEEEIKAYTDAIKLDEAEFGKGAKLAEEYSSQLPAFFKKHGIAADKANAIVNDFVKMQKEAEKETTAKIAKFREWRQGEMKKMNDAYMKEYDQAGRSDIARAIVHFFPKGSAMFEAVCRTEVGVDPGFLKAMKFIGERLPKDKAPGAAAGAGTGSSKSISDSFMGL